MKITIPREIDATGDRVRLTVGPFDPLTLYRVGTFGFEPRDSSGGAVPGISLSYGPHSALSFARIRVEIVLNREEPGAWPMTAELDHTFATPAARELYAKLLEAGFDQFEQVLGT